MWASQIIHITKDEGICVSTRAHDMNVGPRSTTFCGWDPCFDYLCGIHLFLEWIVPQGETIIIDRFQRGGELSMDDLINE